MFTCGMEHSHSTTKHSQSKHPKPGCWQGPLTESPETIHRTPEQQITLGKKYARLFSYLLRRDHCKWQETVTGNTECRLRGFIWREKEDWCWFRCAEKHAMNTTKPAHVANRMYEPPELNCTYSAKSSLAKQYSNKAREVKANRDKVTQAGHSSSRHFSEGKVRSGGDLCSFKQRATFFVTVHIFLILDRVTVALCLFR